MLYIVTTRQPTDDVSGLELHELPEVPSPPNVHRRAVATLEDVNACVYEQVALATGGPEDDAVRRHIGRLPESGGTVGLPDGTVIEVERIGRIALFRKLPTIVQARFGHAANVREAEVVAAFNTVQAH